MTSRKDGYLEGNGYIVTWCVGYLVEFAADQYDPRYSKWVREDLPIVPETWNFAVSTGTKKPFQRLWISSMEDSVIQKGFDNLLSGTNYDSLYDAALCRAKADWLVGINGTRLFTTLYRGKTLNLGRVMTPTLTLLVEREAAISGFREEKFYMVELNCNVFAAVSERITGKEAADKLRLACDGQAVTVQTVDRQDKTERPPKSARSKI